MRNIKYRLLLLIKKYRRLFIAIIATLALIYIPICIALWIAHDFHPDFMKIDSCLDSGGHWNYESQECEDSRYQ